MFRTESSGLRKQEKLRSATRNQIEQHSENVLKNKTPGDLAPCPKCQTPAKFFKRHDKRYRIFLIIVDQIVEKVNGFLALFKCPGCGKCFTEYPVFALPYKRYTLQTILSFCRRYVDNPKMTYRRLLRETPVGYGPNEGISPDSQLDHSTIHRWIGSLGCFDLILRQAQKLILEKDPADTICRDLAQLTISCRKYTTEKRKTLLLGCRRLLTLEERYHNSFGFSIFHKLATDCGYG